MEKLLKRSMSVRSLRLWKIKETRNTTDRVLTKYFQTT